MSGVLARFSTFAACLLLSGSVLGSAGAAGRDPTLLSAASRRQHVVVTFSVIDVTPGTLVVATSPRVDSAGALIAGVRVRERLGVSTTNGTVRWRSRARLARGRYYVQVSGTAVGGVTDCVHPRPGCGQKWSNVREVRIAGA